jgi:hypothetical protein
MKILAAVLACALVLAGCAPQAPSTETGSNNPLESECRAEGVEPGADMPTCIRHHAATGIAHDTCERKGLKSGSPQMQQCVKYEAEFIDATQQCLSDGVSVSDDALLRSCIAGKAPDAAAYEGIKPAG